MLYINKSHLFIGHPAAAVQWKHITRMVLQHLKMIETPTFVMSVCIWVCVVYMYSARSALPKRRLFGYNTTTQIISLNDQMMKLWWICWCKQQRPPFYTLTHTHTLEQRSRGSRRVPAPLAGVVDWLARAPARTQHIICSGVCVCVFTPDNLSSRLCCVVVSYSCESLAHARKVILTACNSMYSRNVLGMFFFKWKNVLVVFTSLSHKASWKHLHRFHIDLRKLR